MYSYCIGGDEVKQNWQNHFYKCSFIDHDIFLMYVYKTVIYKCLFNPEYIIEVQEYIIEIQEHIIEIQKYVYN